MNLMTEGDGWRAGKRPVRKRTVVIILATLLSLALAGVLGWLVVATLQNRQPRPEPVASGPEPLTTLEIVGINTLLSKETAGAHGISGTITDNDRTFGIRLTYLADGSTGSGTLSAGGLRGDVLIQDGAALLRGEPTFWRALGVVGPPPPPPGWVTLPADFLGSKVFITPQAWTAALQPTGDATLEGDTYFSGRGEASATVTEKGITHIHVSGLDAEIRPVTPIEVSGPVGQLGADRGPVVTLTRNPKGDWAFPTPPAPGPDNANNTTNKPDEAGDEETSGESSESSAEPTATETPAAKPR